MSAAGLAAVVWALVVCTTVLVSTVLVSTAMVGQAHADDWQVEADDDRQRRVIERYREMLEENPVEGMALERLLGHVGRGAGLDGLINHYRGRVESSPDSVNMRLILGHLLKARGDYEDAYEHYDRAVELAAHNSLTWMSRGTIYLLTGERRKAMADFEEALERESSRERRQELLQELGELSFSQREFERGKEFFDRLLSELPRDEFVRMEYVRLLVQYRQLDEALEQYEVLLRMVSGDPRRRATMMADKAEVYELQGDWDAAIETYESTLSMVQSDSWLAREVRGKLVDIFRQSGRLEEFVDTYGQQWRRGDSAQQMAVADIYTEMGRLEDALELYQRLARRSRTAVEPREKIVSLLERLGRDDEIPGAYRDLMRAAPRSHRYGLELARYYMRLGDRDQAESVLEELRRRFWNESYVVLELAEHYGRWNFDDEAERAYERVLSREGDDSAVIIDVGDYYFDRGNRSRALEIWRTLPESTLGQREGSRRMAELLVERGIMAEGISVFERLIEDHPDDERLLRSMARALERARRWDDALQRWQELLEITENSRQQREARSRIVQLYERQQQLRAQIMRWSDAFEQEEAQEAVEAGFFLAEAHIRLREINEAEQILIALKDSDDLGHQDRTTVLLLLEQAYVRSERFDEAIAVLEELSEHDPQMRGELLQRKSDHAMEARADDAAVSYALQFLDANPDDARGQTRLGDVYRHVGDLEGAARHYSTAADIDPRAFDVRLKLGEVLVALGRLSEAEQILMEVVENASEDHLVRDAGAAMLRLARRHGRLDALETRWAPLAFRLPLRQAHAELMFDLYDLIAGPLMLRAYHGTATAREESQTRLYELGGRSASMLVEQLRSDSRGARMRALRMVAEMEVDLASSQVKRMLGQEDERLRPMAIVVAARLGDERFVEPLMELSEQGSATLRQLAIWALGHIDSSTARQALVDIVEQSPEGWESQLALFGLWSLQGADEVEVGRAWLERLVEDAAMDRREAALLLSVVGRTVFDGQGEVFRPLLTELARERQDRIGTWAAGLLGWYGDVDGAAVLWGLALSEDPATARRGEVGLAQMIDQSGPPPRRWAAEVRFFDWQDAKFQVARLLRSMEPHRIVDVSDRDGEAQWPQALDRGLSQAVNGASEDPLSPSALLRITSGDSSPLWSPDNARRFARGMVESSTEQEQVLRILRDGVGEVDDLEGLDDQALTLVLRAIAFVGGASVEQDWSRFFEDALAHETTRVRREALLALAASASPQELSQPLGAMILEALHDEAPTVQLAAVHAVGQLGIVQARQTLVDLEVEARPNLRRAVRQARRALDESGLDGDEYEPR